MGWFSKQDKDFFLSTVLPGSGGADGPRVADWLGVVHGEAVIGANIFRDMFSSIRDVVGGRAGGYERALSGHCLPARQTQRHEAAAPAATSAPSRGHATRPSRT